MININSGLKCKQSATHANATRRPHEKKKKTDFKNGICLPATNNVHLITNCAAKNSSENVVPSKTYDE